MCLESSSRPGGATTIETPSPEDVALPEREMEYVLKRHRSIPKFWSRLGGRIPLEGMTVLEVGCGYGCLCIDVGLAGAAKVVGIDISEEVIRVAKAYLTSRFPAVADRVDFVRADVRDYPDDEGPFDYIVSQDAFEHIMDLESVLTEMKRRLKPGGRICAGFGPLYNSPFGGHRRMGMRVPWGHLIFPESWIIRRLNRNRTEKLRSIYDLGLNKMSLADYRRAIARAGLSVVRFKVNHGDRPLSRLCSCFSKIPGLQEYFSHDVYCILEREA